MKIKLIRSDFVANIGADELVFCRLIVFPTLTRLFIRCSPGVVNVCIIAAVVALWNRTSPSGFRLEYLLCLGMPTHQFIKITR